MTRASEPVLGYLQRYARRCARLILPPPFRARRQTGVEETLQQARKTQSETNVNHKAAMELAVTLHQGDVATLNIKLDARAAELEEALSSTSAQACVNPSARKRWSARGMGLPAALTTRLLTSWSVLGVVSQLQRAAKAVRVRAFGSEASTQPAP